MSIGNGRGRRVQVGAQPFPFDEAKVDRGAKEKAPKTHGEKAEANASVMSRDG